MEKFREILDKYEIKVDYELIIKTVDSLFREYNYQKENYWRTTLDKTIQLVPSVSSLPNTYHYKDLFLDNYFVYNLNNNKYHEEDIRLFYAVVVFLNEYFYIDDDFDIEKIKLLKKLINDKDLNKLLLRVLDKKSKGLVRESSYYYKKDVYEFVVENKLIN